MGGAKSSEMVVCHQESSQIAYYYFVSKDASEHDDCSVESLLSVCTMYGSDILILHHHSFKRFIHANPYKGKNHIVREGIKGRLLRPLEMNQCQCPQGKKGGTMDKSC